MLSITNQNPSTPALRSIKGDDLWLSCWSIPSKVMFEEQVRGWRDIGNAIGLVGAIDGPVGGDGEKLDLGVGIMIKFRLEDLDMFFPVIAPGSCNGNLHEYFKSCIVFKWSKTILIVGLSDGSLWRHLWATSAIVRAALAGNRPFNWGSMINDNLQSSAKKGRLHLTKFISSLGWRLSRFFLPVSSSRSTIPKHQTLLFGVSTPLSSVSTDTFANAWIRAWDKKLMRGSLKYQYKNVYWNKEEYESSTK